MCQKNSGKYMKIEADKRKRKKEKSFYELKKGK